MSLQINNSTAFDALTQMGSFDASEASADFSLAKAAQQNAETQDYIKASRVAMRDAMVQAETSKAMAEDMMNQFQLDNPDLAKEMYETGAIAKISENLSSLSNNEIVYASNKLQNLAENGSNYPDIYKDLTKRSPGVASSLPTPDELAESPKRQEQLKLISGMTFQTHANKVASSLQEQQDKAAMLREVAGNKSAEKINANNVSAQRAMNAEDNTATAEQDRLNRESQERIWAGRGETAEMVATIREAGRESTAKIKADAYKKGGNYVPKISDYKDQFQYGSAVIDDMISNADVNPPKGNLNAFKAKTWAEAQSEYTKQSEMYKKGTQATLPKAPSEIFIELSQKKLAAPGAYEKGFNFSGLRGNIDVNGKPAPYNARQEALMKDPAFKGLSESEQQIVLDNLQ